MNLEDSLATIEDNLMVILCELPEEMHIEFLRVVLRDTRGVERDGRIMGVVLNATSQGVRQVDQVWVNEVLFENDDTDQGIIIKETNRVRDKFMAEIESLPRYLQEKVVRRLVENRPSSPKRFLDFNINQLDPFN